MLAGFLFRLLLLTMQGQAGLTVAMVFATVTVSVAALFVQAAGMTVGKGNEKQEAGSENRQTQAGSSGRKRSGGEDIKAFVCKRYLTVQIQATIR